MQARQGDDDEVEQMRMCSTMNSMYIGSTINKPNVESIINAVAIILHSQMLEVSSHSPALTLSLRIGSKPRQDHRKE